MAQINGYKEELQEELQKTDQNTHASRLLAQEIERLEKGEDRKDNRSIAFIDVHPQQPQPVGLRVRIPIQEFPKFNFVGKLLGPKGNTLKRLQEETGCKMAILGKGSMRDKGKEDDLRKEGGKYSHLNEDLHVYVEAFAEMTDGYRRLAHAVSELKKFLIPEPNDDIRAQQMEEMMMYSGDSGRGGGRGGFRGRGAPAGRGAPPPVRGAPRGGAAPVRGAPRGAPAPRGAAPMRGGRGRGSGAPPQASSYEEYSGFSSARGGSGYEDNYSSSRGGGYGDNAYSSQANDGQYYSSSYSGGGASGGATYDYDSYDTYGDSWGSNGSSAGPMKGSRGGGAKPRSHPYNSSRGGY